MTQELNVHLLNSYFTLELVLRIPTFNNVAVFSALNYKNN
jgi:hypothetical protein